MSWCRSLWGSLVGSSETLTASPSSLATVQMPILSHSSASTGDQNKTFPPKLEGLTVVRLGHSLLVAGPLSASSPAKLPHGCFGAGILSAMPAPYPTTAGQSTQYRRREGNEGRRASPPTQPLLLRRKPVLDLPIREICGAHWSPTERANVLDVGKRQPGGEDGEDRVPLRQERPGPDLVLGEVALGILKAIRSENPTTTDNIFLNGNGRPLRSIRTSFENAVRKVCSNAEPRPRFHDLRKTGATRIETVSSHATAKRFLGHADADEPDTYLLPSLEAVREAVNRAVSQSAVRRPGPEPGGGAEKAADVGLRRVKKRMGRTHP